MNIPVKFSVMTIVAASCSVLLLPTVLQWGRRFLCAMAGNIQTNAELPGTFSIAYVTTPNEEVAKTLATDLVKNKLAACVNIIPTIYSVYEWKNEIQKDSEALMVIKTRTSRINEVTTFVRENHPYDVCEVISVPIQHGNPPYMKWLGEIVAEKSSA